MEVKEEEEEEEEEDYLDDEDVNRSWIGLEKGKNMKREDFVAHFPKLES